MNKKLKALIATGLLIGMVPTSALAASPSNIRHSAETRMMASAVEARTTDVATFTINVNGTPATLTLEGIERKATFKDGSGYNHNIVFSKGPVKIKFSNTKINGGRSVTITDKKYSKIKDGRMLYTTANAPGKVVFKDFASENQEITVKEQGMYSVSFTGGAGQVITRLYIGDPSEDLTYRPDKNGTAIPKVTSLTVEGKRFNVPSYEINGELCIRPNDIGYMLSGTSKKCKVEDGSIINLDLFTFRNGESYTRTGKELKALPSGNKSATVAKTEIRTLKNAEVYPTKYKVGTETFLSLSDMSDILDFNYQMAESTALKNAKAKIQHLTYSLKNNYLGIKNQATWEVYIKEAKSLIAKIPSSERGQRDALTAEVIRDEGLVKAVGRINHVEKSIAPKSEGGYGNYLGIKNAETWNGYLQVATEYLEKVDKKEFQKQYNELIARRDKVQAIVTKIEDEFKVEYDRVVKMFNEAKESNDLTKLKEALKEAEKLGTCPRSDALEKEIKEYICG